MTQSPAVGLVGLELKTFIRDVADFPKPGVVFKDLTPLLRNYEALELLIDGLAQPWTDSALTAVAGVEARGFLLAPLVAQRLGVGMVPIRKPGKLPWKVIRQDYSLEYGTDSLEMHVDAVGPGDRVLVLDDVLATGGTAAAAVSIVRQAGAEVVGAAFAIELCFLEGREVLQSRAGLSDAMITSVLSY
jgi:adenine phosphoribosyltransferase